MEKFSYELILNICIFLKEDDLYNFLEAMDKMYYFNNICKYIYHYYINKLERYYIYSKDEESLYYLNEYTFNRENIEFNENIDNDVSIDELFPYDKTNNFTKFCSEMIIEYVNSFKYVEKDDLKINV